MQIKTTRDGTKYNWIVSGEKAGPPQGQSWWDWKSRTSVAGGDGKQRGTQVKATAAV